VLSTSDYFLERRVHIITEGVMSGIITEPMFLQQFPQMEPKNKSGAIQALVVAI